MERQAKYLFLCVVAFSFSACAGTLPEPRLQAYVPSPTIQADALAVRRTPLDVALVVINDATGKDSAPPLSGEELRPVPELFRILVERDLPVKVVRETPVRVVSDRAETISWKQIAGEQGVETLLFAVLSHVEQRSQDSLLLDGSHEGGGAMGTVLGSVTSDYALVELALLDMKANQVLARAEGRGWATLEEIDSGLASNVYPAIRKAGRPQRYFPPREDPAKRATLHWIAGEDALGQAVEHLKENWRR
ncbi:MAG: conserved exported protein of unknown function [Nitrospira sp.]|nr:MAG: conserved exported protein of unknown function [Nitrospira sp.]